LGSYSSPKVRVVGRVIMGKKRKKPKSSVRIMLRSMGRLDEDMDRRDDEILREFGVPIRKRRKR